jgi:hypothetical protein
MNEHPSQEWLEKTAGYSGVFACGVRLPNKSMAIKTYDESFPEARLGELLQCLTEVAFTLRNSQLGSSRLRWVFEHGQLLSVRRLDGAIAVLAMNKDPNAASAIEELIAEFLAAGSPAAEEPALTMQEVSEPGGWPDSGEVR